MAALALKELDAAAAKGFAGLLADTSAWWNDFWLQGFVYMHSPDGQADFVEQNYTYFLYLMRQLSRRLPAAFRRNALEDYGRPQSMGRTALVGQHKCLLQ